MTDMGSGSDAESPKALVTLSFDIGVKNLAVAAIDTEYKIHVWKVIALAETKEKIPGLNEISGRLFMALDELVGTDLEGCVIERVLLENQPSRLNGSMKSIQMMIYSYFQLRRHWEGLVADVLMVAASGKLKHHEYDPGVPVVAPGRKPKTGYELNKWKAIQIARHYIKDDATLVKHFETYKKMDDLSDALLQAISWLRKRGDDVQAVKSKLA